MRQLRANHWLVEDGCELFDEPRLYRSGERGRKVGGVRKAFRASSLNDALPSWSKRPKIAMSFESNFIVLQAIHPIDKSFTLVKVNVKTELCTNFSVSEIDPLRFPCRFIRGIDYGIHYDAVVERFRWLLSP